LPNWRPASIRGRVASIDRGIEGLVETKPIVSYFLDFGGRTIVEAFEEALRAVETSVKKHLASFYGRDLSLILIIYRVQGVTIPVVPDKIRVGHYSAKEKSVGATVGIRAGPFSRASPIDRRRLLAETTISAVKAVRDRLLKRGLDINFDRILSDLDKAIEEAVAAD
jgi:hypothetical protein